MLLRAESLVYRAGRRHLLSIRRGFAVKELPWCAPSDSPTRRRSKTVPRTSTTTHPNLEKPPQADLTPISRFGIVAAMSTNSVIGIDGALPWNLIDDRRRFKELTRDTILVLGRKTLEEEANLRHIAHASHAIVLSRTLVEADLPATDDIALSIATSFPHALEKARQLSDKLGLADDTAIRCWVVGGEQVYHEALLHPSAEEMHLTVVDTVVDEERREQVVSRFPAKYRWDNKFKIESSESQTDEASGLVYRFDVYRRLRGRR